MAVRPIDANAMLNELRPVSFEVEHSVVLLSDVSKMMREWIERQPALTPPNEWISVEERLPEGHMQVLMWSARWKIAEAGSYYNKHFWVYTEIGDGYIADNITHWMPLPAPPDSRPPEGEEDT